MALNGVAYGDAIIAALEAEYGPYKEDIRPDIVNYWHLFGTVTMDYIKANAEVTPNGSPVFSVSGSVSGGGGGTFSANVQGKGKVG